MLALRAGTPASRNLPSALAGGAGSRARAIAISATASTIQWKLSGPDRFEPGVRRGIHEVDGVRNAVLHRELHRVQVVAERAAERQRSRCTMRSPQRGRRRRIAGHIAQMVRLRPGRSA